ncbi:MAG: FAD-dependent oxidoreductase [Pseudomonadota bacterium]|nr:FAD-dependent oxidoreductase [Pseudomonadota bacterium]
MIWVDLIQSEQYHKLDKAFLDYLQRQGLSWSDFEVLPTKEAEEQNDLEKNIIDLANQLEGFLLSIFPVSQEYHQYVDQLSSFETIERFLQLVSKPAARQLKLKAKIDETCVNQVMLVAGQYAKDEHQCVTKLLTEFEPHALIQWFQYICIEQLNPYVTWQVFQLPKRVDYNHLVTVNAYKPRFDYRYTGATRPQIEIERQIHYCIDCHLKQNDSCSKGMIDRKSSQYKISPLGRVLMGCPLNQKISQMHMLRKRHKVLAALAVTMLDNPLCAATGDRICNDCMAACIYQKFEPVDTPSVESNTLELILSLPYGAEIYLLLARWNPLAKLMNQFSQQEYPKRHSGSVAVVGMGPAGIAMSYYLLHSGLTVFGFDGLAIREKVGNVLEPIKSFHAWADKLLEDGPLCFGGVMDYGITARWDKRKIALLWALLHRFKRFKIKGHIRLGGAVTIPSLKQLGFDHVVLATGAGLPQAHPLQKHQGMVFANEFLMRLQISGMMHKTLKSGLSLPIIVVGGGLTAIDCATEAQVYYLKWVEQVAFWCDSVGIDVLIKDMSEWQKAQVLVWQAHGVRVRKLRLEQNIPHTKAFFEETGGVSIVYRKSMQESPAYKTNYLEVEKALEQGIIYIENTNPVRVTTTQDGRVSSLICYSSSIEGEVTIPAQTVMFATGSKPNVAYYFENRSDLKMSESGYYKRATSFFAESDTHPDYVTIIGDLHPEYQGSVVGALASAKDSYMQILNKVSQGAQLTEADVLDGITISINHWEASDQFIRLDISTQLPLPLGGYLRITVFDERHTLTPVSAVIVSQEEAWVKADCEGIDDLKHGRISGVLGPSGTRVVSQSVTKTAKVITDKMGLAWACSIANAIKIQGKICEVVCLSKTDVALSDYFDKVYFVEKQEISKRLFTATEDLYFCVSGALLKELQIMNFPANQSYAVVDGGMMCFLKGICGQCIQWQVDQDGNSLKAVYACSWQAQPLTLIDVNHVVSRQQKKDETQLYQNWKKRMRSQEINYV